MKPLAILMTSLRVIRPVMLNERSPVADSGATLRSWIAEAEVARSGLIVAEAFWGILFAGAFQ